MLNHSHSSTLMLPHHTQRPFSPAEMKSKCYFWGPENRGNPPS
jgi:hypothetical protein